MPSESLIQRLPRRLKMSELRIFVAALEHRSFHKAAAVVNLTQPAVTKAIAGLEDTLGVRLFDRTANGVEPTVHGLAFAPRAVAIFDELRRAAQDLTLVSSGALGSLRIGTVPMPAIPFLPVAIARLVQAHPDLFVSVLESRETELLDSLRRRDIEVAILRLALLEPDEDMQVDTLFDERLCVVAARDHPLASRPHLAWPDLQRERWVLPPPECIFFEHVVRTLDELGFVLPRHSVQSYSVHIQHGMVLHGGMLGLGMRSGYEFAPAHRNPIVRLPIELGAVARPVGAVTLRGREPSPLARQLVGHIRDQMVVQRAALHEPVTV
jgi:DNA-binding transcriptional LysR family regulator